MSKLYLVPTPVGNLRDITFRAVEVLENADLILAEDTRQARKLLTHYKITTPVQSHHMFNEHKTVEAICAKISSGQTIALVSDAGTPGMSESTTLKTSLRQPCRGVSTTLVIWQPCLKSFWVSPLPTLPF